MKTKFKQLLIAASVLAVLVILPAAVKADPIVMTLDPSQTVAAGSSVTFMGSLSNGGNPISFINSVAFTFAGPSGVTFDDTAFFANVPPFLGPGATTVVVDFFDAIVSALVPAGSYTGSFSVLGGASATDEDLLATQEFVLNVVDGGPGGVIPEPTTMLLLGSGLASAAALRRRKRRQAETP